MPDAIILCGGLGTRMRPALGNLPKTLAPVAGRPFLDHILDHLARHGIKRVVMAAGSGAEKIRAHCGNGSRWSLQFDWTQELNPLGTGGAIAVARHLVSEGPFWVLAGDSLLTADLGEIEASHRERRAAGTIALAQVSDRSRFGSIELAPGCQVTRFTEKGVAGPGWINAGLYLLSPLMFSELQGGRPGSLEFDVLPRWIGRGLYGHRSDADFADIGIPESYRAVRSGARQWSSPAGSASPTT